MDIEDLASGDARVTTAYHQYLKEKKKYFKLCDEFCSMLKKRHERPPADDEDELDPHHGQSQIPRK